MKQLLKALRGRQCLVFLDVEATQIHHEIIEIGAVKALLDEGYQPFGEPEIVKDEYKEQIKQVMVKYKEES